MRTLHFTAAIAGCFALNSFCSLYADDDATREHRDVNAGYFLLHKLFDDESNLVILLDLKHSPQEIQDYAKQISQTAKQDLATLDKIHDADPKVNWDEDLLPKFEQDVRSSIAGEKQHQLLFGTSNDDFVRALLVSQTEATQYASNLAKVMAQRTKNADRQRDFTHMSEHWQSLYEKDFKLLKNY